MTNLNFTDIVFSVSKKKKLLVLAPIALLFLGLLIFLFVPKEQKITQVPNPSPSASPGVLAVATEGAQPNILGIGTSPTPETSTVSTPTPTPASTSTQAISVASPSPLLALTPNCQQSADNLTFNIVLTGTSDVSFTFIEPANLDIPSALNVQIPDGWNIPLGSTIPQKEVIASGCLSYMLGGSSGTSQVTILNDQNTQGHRLKWDLVFGNLSSPDVTIESFIDGDSKNGYTWTIDRKFLFDIRPPITFNIILSNKYISKSGKSGDNLFSGVIKFVGGTTATLSKLLSLF